MHTGTAKATSHMLPAARVSGGAQGMNTMIESLACAHASPREGHVAGH